MNRINLAVGLKKQGFKLTPLPSPTPEHMKEIQKTNEGVCEFLQKLHEAYKASKNSKLRFCQKTETQNAPNEFVHQHLKMMERIKRATDESVKHCHHYARERIITTYSHSNPSLRHFQRVKD